MFADAEQHAHWTHTEERAVTGSAVDVVAVRGKDGVLRCSSFGVKFSASQTMTTKAYESVASIASRFRFSYNSATKKIADAASTFSEDDDDFYSSEDDDDDGADPPVWQSTLRAAVDATRAAYPGLATLTVRVEKKAFKSQPRATLLAFLDTIPDLAVEVV